MYTEFTVYHNTLPLYCRTAGHGPALLLIHGSCADSDFFLHAADCLSHFFTVYIYDRRGSGRSGNDFSGNYSVSAQAEDALAVLKKIDAPCYLAAHSAGCACFVPSSRMESKYHHSQLPSQSLCCDGLRAYILAEAHPAVVLSSLIHLHAFRYFLPSSNNTSIFKNNFFSIRLCDNKHCCHIKFFFKFFHIYTHNRFTCFDNRTRLF